MQQNFGNDVPSLTMPCEGIKDHHVNSFVLSAIDDIVLATKVRRMKNGEVSTTSIEH